MADQPALPNLDGLTALANRDGVDIKPTLLRVMTDLYVQKPVHSVEEERHYTELSMRLIDRVDLATRAIVAERLAKYPTAPRSVIQRLLRGREPQPQTAPSHTNSPAPNTATSAATLTELSELFLAANAEDRRMILLHLEYGTLAPAVALDAIAAQDSIRRLEMAALNHNADAFALEIESALGIARTMARRLIDDESGEPVLVLAMALGMPSEVLQRILLCLNPKISHSVLRVYELSTLYEELEPHSALRLTAIWQKIYQAEPRSAAPRAAVLQPQYWHDDSKHEPMLPTRPAIRWEEHAPRFKAEG
jgi:hypothetical protein